MHGEIHVTVIATGFDRAVTGDQPFTRTGASPAGVLNFPTTRQRSSMPSMPAAPQAAPPTAPRAAPRTPPPAPGATDVPEMEIPTFIRRQMD
jgi:hypothetical protein